jgi:hypothetical protein
MLWTALASSYLLRLSWRRPVHIAQAEAAVNA